MFVLLYFIVILLFIRKSRSVAIILVLLHILSRVAAIIIDRNPTISTVFDFFNVGFTLITLTIIIYSFVKYGKVSEIVMCSPKKLDNVSRLVFILSSFSLVVSFYVGFHTWFSVNDFGAFKNGGEAETLLYALPISHSFITLSSIFSPFGYLALGFHFLYLYKKMYKKALLFFIMSLSIPIYGLTTFSRSSIVTYILLYIVYTVLIYTALSKDGRKILKKGIVAIISFVLIIFISITINRFNQDQALYSVITEYSNSSIKNIAIYSVLDYVGQWYENGITVLKSYTFNPSYGRLSNSLFYWLNDVLNLHLGDGLTALQVRQQLFPNSNHWAGFLGLIALLIYDFGYVGTFLFSLLFYTIIKHFAPKEGRMNSTSILLFGGLIMLPLMSFIGNELESVNYHLEIVYSIIIYMYLKMSTNVQTKS